LELRDYIDILYNRKWIVVGTLVIVLALALIITFVQSPTYESSVKILADINSASDAVLGDLLPTGVSEVDRFIQNTALAQAVARQLQYKYEQAAREKKSSKTRVAPDSAPKAAELKKMVSVRLGAKTGIFDIVVTGGDPALTRDIAQVYADEYLSNRQLASIQQISEARKEVWNRVQEVEEQLQKVSQEIKKYKAGEVPTDLQASAQQAATLWTTLYEKYISLRISESLGQRGLEIVEAAASGIKVGPKPARNGILALFLGLVLGVGLAFFVDYMDDTLHTREDFEHGYDTSVVGEIPLIPEEELPEFSIVYFEKPRHQAVEGYRTLRTNLQFLNIEGGRGAILFTSALPGEGKSTIIVNLGAALSEMGKKVLLVEADMRKPVLGKFFALGAVKGLTGVLAGTCSLEDAVHSTGYENLYVLPAGVRPPNPGELVASDSMRRVLEKVRESADYVLVDAPPVLAANDALALAPMADGVIIVGRYGMADRDGAKRTIELLRKVEANILGLVINNLETGKRYGYYHYYYYDADAEGDKAGKGSKTRRLAGKKSKHVPPPQD
jgi:succinoglycan biosynthesis transport protein ExoP